MKNFNFVKKLLFIFILLFGLYDQLTVLNAQSSNLNYGDIYSDKNKLDKKPKYPIIPEVSTFIIPFLLFIIIAAETIRKIRNVKQQN